MASVQEYIEKQTDEKLKGALFSYCMGATDISASAVLYICKVLAQRNPELPDPYKLFRDLCRKYC